jgi:hypothetical protein
MKRLRPYREFVRLSEQSYCGFRASLFAEDSWFRPNLFFILALLLAGMPQPCY